VVDNERVDIHRRRAHPICSLIAAKELGSELAPLVGGTTLTLTPHILRLIGRPVKREVVLFCKPGLIKSLAGQE
jgi:hypothetical protein